MSRFAIGALALGMVVGVVACPGGTAPAGAPAPGPRAEAQGILALEGTWTDQDGRGRTLAELRGRPLLVAMVFTRCGYACPRTVSDLQGILAALPSGQRSGVGVLLVSFDHERDDPAALRAFAAERGLDPATWTLLRGGADDVRTLAAALGVRYRAAEGGGFAHSNLITVLDRAGRVAHQVEGLGVAPAAVLPAVSAALAQEEGRVP
jgi:protein SCO1/2